MTPKGYVMTAAQLLVLQATLIAGARNTNKALRLFPIKGFEAINDASEGLQVQTMGYGPKHPVREGFNDWTFNYTVGGVKRHQSLRKFNGDGNDFLFWDDQNTIWGTSGLDNTGAAGLKAIPSDGGFFWAHPWKANTGSEVTGYTLQFVFNPYFVNDMVEFATAGFDIATTVNGLVDVLVTSPSANATSGSYNLMAVTAGAKTNLASIYGTELGVIGAWSAINTQTGLAIAILTATYGANVGGAGIGGWVLALDKTDANYPATAGFKITFALASPTALAALGVLDYEGNTVDIVKN